MLSKISDKDNLLFIFVLVILILLITFPYLYAFFEDDDEYIFGGFLINPIDGNSYLAKMYQGWQGNWQFRLPYTRDAEKVAFLFLLYLFLGNVSRIIDLPIILTFHIARVVSSAFMLISMWRFFKNTLVVPRYYRCAFILGVFGSGMGWLASLFGAFTSDLWVAEAFPFLSAYSNPHFPLGIAILLLLITPNKNGNLGVMCRQGVLNIFSNFIWTIFLTLIMPFGSVIALILNGLILILRVFISQSHLNQLFHDRYVLRLLGVSLGASPVLLYYGMAIHSDPWLAGWNAQNVTPSPSLFDLIVSLSPAMFLAIFSLKRLIHQRDINLWQLFLWSLVGIILIYLPFGLQRRMMLGIFIPFAGLSAIVLGDMIGKKRHSMHYFAYLIYLLSFLSNTFSLASSFYGIHTHHSLLYLKKSEFQALNWIEKNTPDNAVILSSPEFGLFIPAYTGRRVIYGHPFETVDSKEQEERIIKFFDNSLDTYDIQLVESVDYIFIGPREEKLGGLPKGLRLTMVYHNQDINIYRLDQ